MEKVFNNDSNLRVWDKKAYDELSKASLSDLLFDEYFLGYTLNKGNVFPEVLETISKAWEGYKNKGLKGTTIEGKRGIGKTTIASILLWLQWYDLTTNCFSKETLDLKAYLLYISSHKSLEHIYKLFQCPFNNDYFPAVLKNKSKIIISRNSTAILGVSPMFPLALEYGIYSACFDEDKDTNTDTLLMIEEKMESRFADDRGMIIIVKYLED